MRKSKTQKLKKNLESWILWWNEYGHKGSTLHRNEEGATVYPPLAVSSAILGCHLPCTTKCAIYQTCKKRKDLEEKEKKANVAR